MQCAAIIPAAGSGLRMGGGQPKALRELDGMPLYLWGLRRLAAHPLVTCIVVATPADHVERVREQITARAQQELDEHGCQVWVVAGGPSRQDTVRIALGNLPQEFTHVLIHDAARPLTPAWVIDAVVGRLEAGSDAVVAAVPVADTIKQIRAESADDQSEESTQAGQATSAITDPSHPAWDMVERTLPRDQLRAVQTPQGFRREVLAHAHEYALREREKHHHQRNAGVGTDDASLVENLGFAVSVVAGASEAFKITTPMDFAVAQMLCATTRQQ